jgi:hypothetical protein
VVIEEAGILHTLQSLGAGVVAPYLPIRAARNNRTEGKESHHILPLEKGGGGVLLLYVDYVAFALRVGESPLQFIRHTCNGFEPIRNPLEFVSSSLPRPMDSNQIELNRSVLVAGNTTSFWREQIMSTRGISYSVALTPKSEPLRNVPKSFVPTARTDPQDLILVF